MPKIPEIGTYFDDEERELIEAIEALDYIPGPSLLTPERKEELRLAARATMKEHPALSRYLEIKDGLQCMGVEVDGLKLWSLVQKPHSKAQEQKDVVKKLDDLIALLPSDTAPTTIRIKELLRMVREERSQDQVS
jgi:hypothetical protein